MTRRGPGARALEAAAVALAVTACALFASSIAMGLALADEDVVGGILWGSAALSLALIGAVVVVQRPRHKVGWLLVAAGFCETVATVRSNVQPAGVSLWLLQSGGPR